MTPGFIACMTPGFIVCMVIVTMPRKRSRMSQDCVSCFKGCEDLSNLDHRSLTLIRGLKRILRNQGDYTNDAHKLLDELNKLVRVFHATNES